MQIACARGQNIYQGLAGVAVSQGKARVGDEVGKAVSAAQQASLAVVGEPLLGALNGGLQGQRRSAALLVLHTSTNRR
jgi:hypothetical protein